MRPGQIPLPRDVGTDEQAMKSAFSLRVPVYAVTIALCLVCTNAVLGQSDAPSKSASTPVVGKPGDVLEEARETRKPLLPDVKEALKVAYAGLAASTNEAIVWYFSIGKSQDVIIVSTPENISWGERCSVQDTKEIIRESWGTNAACVRYSAHNRSPDRVLGIRADFHDIEIEDGLPVLDMEVVLCMHAYGCQQVVIKVVKQKGKWVVRSLRPGWVS